MFKSKKKREEELQKTENEQLVKDKEACEAELAVILKKYNLRLAVKISRGVLGPVTERADIIFVRQPEEESKLAQGNTITQMPVNGNAPGQFGPRPGVSTGDR